MNANRKAKEKEILEISKILKESKSLVVAEYAGLSVKELQELKSKLKESQVFTKIYKNRLFKLAVKDAKWKDLKIELIGPNIFLFGKEDDVAPAKIAYNFSKEHKALKLKSGLYEDKVVNFDELVSIASLPSYDEAIGMLSAGLFSPIKSLAIGLNMLTKTEHLKGE